MTAPRRTTNNRPSPCLELPSGAPRRRQHTRRRGRQGIAQTGRASGVPAKEANRIASGAKAGREKAVHAREEEGARRGQKARDPGRRRRTTATRKIVAREQAPLDEDSVDNHESAPGHDGRRDTSGESSALYGELDRGCLRRCRTQWCRCPGREEGDGDHRAGRNCPMAEWPTCTSGSVEQKRARGALGSTRPTCTSGLAALHRSPGR